MNFWWGVQLFGCFTLFRCFLPLCSFSCSVKQARDSANLALVRNRKANKMALKRLKLAAIYLKDKKKELFYDEVLKACWGYLSDKLNIPMADLTKENMQSELVNHDVNENSISRLMELLALVNLLVMPLQAGRMLWINYLQMAFQSSKNWKMPLSN